MITGNEPISALPLACNGQLFNRQDATILEQSGALTGLTIRQHFAAMAMQGLMSNTEKSPMTDNELCEFAVRISDTLIAELNKGQ